MKTLPKSLHTITSVTNVARYYKATNAGITPQHAVATALTILGYDMANTSDEHGLVAKCVAILTKEA